MSEKSLFHAAGVFATVEPLYAERGAGAERDLLQRSNEASICVEQTGSALKITRLSVLLS